MSSAPRIAPYHPVRTPGEATAKFVRAAADYSQLGLDCFNLCVQPGEPITSDMVLGVEKRCMDGCLSVNLQNFTIYGTSYSQ